MRSHQLTIGRTFALVVDHGEDLLSSLSRFCHDNAVRAGYIPTFVASFSEADIVGTCQRLDNPGAPVRSAVHLRNTDGVGAGTVALDPATGEVRPHLHVALGVKEHSATAHASHLFNARVQFSAELIVVEAAAPSFQRVPEPGLYGVPLLWFG
ncbi:PPC domain-containing DNA-binding protein [Nocardia thailandica]|uniref:PPC domain-containing DNA-binding protein n=1 Tax=Nocardia thailandica TaxID=257275 RepID=UPI0002F00142|nr:DUF296 domain-containing protein [Nocardia thailandica]